MADTCIVCLGDLNLESPRASPAPAEPANSWCEPGGPLQLTGEKQETAIPSEPDLIAHIPSCGHSLHNDCLKPWVERANSCPICRQNFNVVELKRRLNGPSFSSYAVEDKQQEADIDPSLVIEEDWLVHEECACVICEDSDHQDSLLICDGCNALNHTYCIGLDGVPAGPWFCPECTVEGLRPSHPRPRQPQHRTRGQQRRRQRRPELRADETEWTRVWQSIFRQTNLDLDYPFESDSEEAVVAESHRQEFLEWQQRFRVAERQGGAARFRDTASTLLNLRSRRARSPTPRAAESVEELRAWNAFDKARELQEADFVGTTQRNKRKSATASPSEPQGEPERKLKRPRTRRVQNVGENASDGVGPSSESAQRSAPSHNPAPEPAESAPSFLQSLLKEVESAPATSNRINGGRSSLTVTVPPTSDYSSAGSPSPFSSPASSNHPSPRPRSASPPRLRLSRPASPPPLTSHVQPAYAHHAEYSPVSPSVKMKAIDRDPDDDSPRSANFQDHSEQNGSPSTVPNPEASPLGRDLSLTAKTEIQAIVKAALRPLYKRAEITTDQYTSINRDVSRRLYELIGDPGGLNDAREMEKWKAVAASEVEEATRGLGHPITTASE